MDAVLILKAFAKARKEIGSAVTKHCAEHLSEEILERKGQPYGERSLRDKYSEAQSGSTSISIPPFAAEALAQYLGYASLKDFLLATHSPKQGQENTGKTNRRIWLYPGLVLILVLGAWILYENPFQTKMMIWVEDHYEVVPLDLEKYRITDLKKIKQDRLDNFRKISPDCSYEYFDEEGLEKLWYGKNEEGQLEYFTDLGRHPETGKTLKKITPYMIRTHICPTYSN